MFDVDRLRLEIEALIRDLPELTDDEVLRADMLEGLTDINAVLTRLFKAADSDRRMVQVLTSDINDIVDRRARLVHRVEAMRDLILQVLQSADLKKVVLPRATLLQVASQPQIVGEPDPDALPAELVRIKREADRAAIREALLAGRIIPGLSLSNAPPHLVIKVK
jgi:Siphovirus Gp157